MKVQCVWGRAADRQGRRSVLKMAGAMTMGVVAHWAHAQGGQFPTKPLRFVVPFPPGSGTDISARFFAQKLTQLTGQPVTIENRPGGNSFIAVKVALSAPPDGYTVFVGGTSAFTTNIVMFKTLPYDPLKDFAPVGILMRGPSVIICAADSQDSTLAAFVERAKASPGKVSVGTGAASYQMAAAAFHELAGIRVINVPFKGASEVATAAASRVIDAGVVDIGSAWPLINGGKVRALAVSAEHRVPELPEVPTYIEAGYPGYTTFNWAGAAVSSRTPPEIVARLGELFRQISSMDETRAAFRKVLNEPVPGGPAEMRQIQAAEIERWKRLAAVAGVVPE